MCLKKRRYLYMMFDTSLTDKRKGKILDMIILSVSFVQKY